MSDTNTDIKQARGSFPVSLTRPAVTNLPFPRLVTALFQRGAARGQPFAAVFFPLCHRTCRSGTTIPMTPVEMCYSSLASAPQPPNPSLGGTQDIPPLAAEFLLEL